MDKQTRDEFLLFFLRTMAPDEKKSAWLEQLSVSDWDDVIQQSVRHRVAPLLYQRLKTLQPGVTIPPIVAQTLRKTYLQSALRNERLYHELAQVLEMLHEDNIPVIALKGADLAQVVYGNIALRPMSDVDLLCRKSDLSRVEEKLVEMDYIPHDNNLQFAKDHFHFVYMPQNQGIPVEVHWHITHPRFPFKIDVDRLWKRTRPATIAGVEILVLSPEDMLLHLCLHASFQHRFRFRLMRIYDFVETIQHYQTEIEWDEVAFRAGQWGAGKCAYLTLYLAKELLGAAVPDAVLETLKPADFSPEVIAWAREQIFAERINGLMRSRNLCQLWGHKRLQDKAIIFLKSVFPSREVMARIYPAAKDSPGFYLYYLMRVKNLLLRYGRSAWQVLHPDQKIIAVAEQEVKRENQEVALMDWLASA